MTSLEIIDSPTPRTKIDMSKIHCRPVNTGFQAAWLKNPDGLTQGVRWLLTNCGSDCVSSPGCHNCLAVAQSLWDKAHGIPLVKVRHLPENLSVPYRWKSRKNCFVCPEGDLFHKNVPDKFIFEAFEVMEECSQHNFVMTTKRAARLSLLSVMSMTNVYVGVSVESQEYMHRAEELVRTPESFKRVLFAAPMLLPLRLPKNVLKGLDWVVCSPERGGAGRTPRPCELEWIESLRDQVKENGIPFFLDTTYTEEVVYHLGRWVEMPSSLLE